MRNLSDYFSVKLVAIDVCTEILALDASKASQGNHIPTKITKNNRNTLSKFFQANFNNIIITNTFPAELKYAAVKPDFK